MVLTLEEVKRQCRVDFDYHGDNDYLYWLIDVAEKEVAQRLRYNTLDEAFPDGFIPPDVRHAMMIIVATKYENAEDLSAAKLHKVPEGVDALLGPYVRYCEQKKDSGDFKVDFGNLRIRDIDV